MSAAPDWRIRKVDARTLRLGSEPPPEVVEWLRGSHLVARVDRHGNSIDVAAREPRLLPRLMRATRDRLFVARRPPPPALSAEVIHAMPGRVRLGVGALSERDVGRLAEWLRTRPGVRRARPSPASGTIAIWYDPAGTSEATLTRDVLASDPRRWPSVPLAAAGWGPTVANTCVLVASTALTKTLPAPMLGAAIACTAVPSAVRAVAALGEGRVGVDALDVAAVALAIGTQRFGTGAFITWLLGIGDLVLARTHARARHAITERLDLEAVEAFRIRGENVERVSARLLRRGDRIVVDTGARVPADGVVESGLAMIDARALTGESLPVERRRGDHVLSATVVVQGQLVIRVERAGEQTTAMRIAEILAGAGTKPMTLQRNAERTADRLVLPTFGLAGAAGVFVGELDRITSILITDFGTGVRVVVPSAALTSMTVAAREGVLVKGGQFLERLSCVDTIIFDKTGTLTRGEPELVAIDVVGPLSPETYVALAAATEARQRHPIARAIRRYARRMGAPLLRAEVGSEVVSVGRGVSARVGGQRVVVGGRNAMREHGVAIGDPRPIFERQAALGASSVLVGVDGVLAAVLAIADEPRQESARVVDALRKGGARKVMLLSGDARATAEAVGRTLGVDRAQGELLPEDKVRIVRELQRDGRTVAMVGDGINDAPALAVADVGISLQGGTDVALEAADVVLLEGGLAKLPYAFEVADRGMANVRRSLQLVLAPNAIGIVLATVGLLPPSAAALVNNGSTVAAALAAVAPLFRRRGARSASAASEAR